MIYLFIITLIFIVLLILLSYRVFYQVLAGFKGAPYAGTNDKKIKKIIEIADLKNDDVAADLGSGDGRILIAAVKSNSRVRCTGYEIDPHYVRISRKKVKALGLQDRIKIIRGDYFKQDLSDFSLIFVFLIPYQMERLEKKLLSELKSGTRVVSYGYQFKNWKHVNVDGNIYLYVK